LSDELRQYHLHVVGQFGRGKSKFLEHLIRTDVINNRGLCLIDPHGSLCDDIVTWVASKGIAEHRKVCLFEPKADSDWVFGFNPLDFRGLTVEQRSDAVDAMVRACAQVWGGEDLTKTPRLARILPAVFHVLGEKNLTLLEALHLCSPAGHSPEQEVVRRIILQEIKDDFFRSEWEYFEGLSSSRYVETFESTRNRLSAFLRNPVVRATVGQAEATLDFRAIMDEGGIVLVNLAHLSKENQRLLGALLVNDLYIKALSRQADDSRPFHLYLDECHRFLTSDVASIVVETRKFGLWLTLAHHNLQQLRSAGDDIHASVMQIPNKVVFGGVTPMEDATELAETLYLGSFDLEEAKTRYNKPVVVGHVREWMAGHGSTTSEGSSYGGGSSSAESAGSSELVTQSMEPESDTDGAVSIGESDGTSYGNSVSWAESESSSESESRQETLRPVFETMPTTPYSLQEHIHRAMATMVNQPTQRAVARLAGRHPELVQVPTIRSAFAGRELVAELKESINLSSVFTLSRVEAKTQLETRKRKLLQLTEKAGEDPRSWRS